MTKAERKHQSMVASLGCIACRIDGIVNTHVSIHHIDGRTKRGAHMRVLALCAEHHQTGGESAPAIHPYKRRFELKYGTQEELLRMTNDMLKET